MRLAALALLAVAVAGSAARAEPLPRLLVLPLPPAAEVDAAVRRAFDARLLVALDASRRVATVTPSDEPECTTPACLVALAAEARAPRVVSLAVQREAGALAIYGAVLDAATGAAVRRVALARIAPDQLAQVAPVELVPQLLGRAPGPMVVAMAVPGPADPAGELARRLGDRLRFAPLDGRDRRAPTHRAEVRIERLAVVDRWRELWKWHDGELIGVLAITDLADGQVVFRQPLSLGVSRRLHFATRGDVVELLVADAIARWADGVAKFWNHRARAAVTAP